MDERIATPEPPHLVVCLRNDEWPDDLVVGKTYRVLPDAPGARSGWIRVIDETDEDYLYPAGYFRRVDAPDARAGEAGVRPTTTTTG